MAAVVVGVDDSKQARAAVHWALRYAHTEQLPVTVLTVVDPLVANALLDADPADSTRSAILAAARAEAREMVAEEIVRTDTSDVDVDVQAVIGHPVKELVDAATEADLIVVGSRGAGAFARLLLGSTSAGVAHHAPGSVMIVRSSDAAGPAPERPA